MEVLSNSVHSDKDNISQVFITYKIIAFNEYPVHFILHFC